MEYLRTVIVRRLGQVLHVAVRQYLQSLWVLDSNVGFRLIIAPLALYVDLLYEHVAPHGGTIRVIAVLVRLKWLTWMADVVVLHVRQRVD